MKEYTVVIDGLEHTMLLDQEDVQRYGSAVKEKAAAPQNKSRATGTAAK